MYASKGCVNLTPLTSKRGARGCSLWRSLLERPPPAPESRVRDPLGELGGYTCFHTHLRHTSNYSHTKKKHDLGPRLVRSFSNSPMVLDGVYGWLHPEVSDRRRDTPKDNERNYHLEKSDDESELRLDV